MEERKKYLKEKRLRIGGDKKGGKEREIKEER